MNTKPSLRELAQQAVAAQETGRTHAALAAEHRQLTPAELSALEQAAIVDPQTKEALGWAAEAREATFTDPFARASYFRLTIKQLLDDPKPDPDMVISTLFSARANKMNVRGQKEGQPAIPLFKSFKDKNEARRFDKQALPIPHSFRNKDSAGADRMGSRDVVYLVPMTPDDRECFLQMKQLLARMPQVLVEHFEVLMNFDTRQAVWLALHFMPKARVVTKQWVERLFEKKDGQLLQRGSGIEFVQYELSPDENLLMEKCDLSERLILQLDVFASAVQKVITKKKNKK